MARQKVPAVKGQPFVEPLPRAFLYSGNQCGLCKADAVVSVADIGLCLLHGARLLVIAKDAGVQAPERELGPPRGRQRKARGKTQ